MDYNFNGFNENVLTFVADNTLKDGDKGITVKLTANGTVGKTYEDDVFVGVLLGVRNGYASVQVSGYCKVKTGTRIEPGYKLMSSDSNGGAYCTPAGRYYFVLDSTEKEAGILL